MYKLYIFQPFLSIFEQFLPDCGDFGEIFTPHMKKFYKLVFTNALKSIIIKM